MIRSIYSHLRMANLLNFASSKLIARNTTLHGPFGWTTPPITSATSTSHATRPILLLWGGKPHGSTMSQQTNSSQSQCCCHPCTSATGSRRRSSRVRTLGKLTVPCTVQGTVMGQESPSSLLSLSGLSLDDMENGVEPNHLVMACTIVDNHN